MSDNSSTEEPMEPDPTEASDADLRLAIAAIGSKARYGGLLSGALAGIYAERQRAAAVRADERTRIATELERIGMEKHPYSTPDSSQYRVAARLIRELGDQ